MEVVDTNVIIRFLVGDNLKQQQQAVQWFSEAEAGKRKLRIKPIVVAEATFVLESFYKKSRQEIADAFEVFLSQRWMQVDEREVLLSIWPLYKQKLHFVDSYLIASARVGQDTVLSFDQALLKQASKV